MCMKTKTDRYVPLAERNVADVDRRWLSDFKERWSKQKKLSESGFVWITANSVKVKADHFSIRTSNIRRGYCIILYVKDIEVANVELKDIANVWGDLNI